MKSILLTLIGWYQKLISPDHSPWGQTHPELHCRYFPTCSEYAKQSIEAHGVVKGGFLSVARVCRCHPFAPRGVDPILDRERN
ncbi:MAG: membrane protein insertion efficiency factor YidD [Patescibacteria group bacterium]|nr:membrane protein insertion efficiency factor YidD [Patescibacteria group bacterium]